MLAAALSVHTNRVTRRKENLNIIITSKEPFTNKL